jgi:hypothetical protein
MQAAQDESSVTSQIEQIGETTMQDHGTLSTEVEILPWYIQFQTDVLSQLPRPGEISQDIAAGWHDNRGAMKKALYETLLPPKTNSLVSEPAALLQGVASELLLEFIGTLTLPTTTERFVAKKKFVINTDNNAEVKLWDMGSNYKAWFLPKIEEPAPETTLRYHRLRKSSRDLPIITELGGEQKVVTTLSGMYSLLKKQGQGQFGELLTNGYANIFYIYDKDGVLRSVDASLTSGLRLAPACSSDRRCE